MLLSLGALRLLRSSRIALTQPDAYGAGESLGGLETMRLGEWILKILSNSKSPKLQVAKAKSQIKIKMGKGKGDETLTPNR